jgi:hypothetical protein
VLLETTTMVMMVVMVMMAMIDDDDWIPIKVFAIQHKCLPARLDLSWP